MLWRHENGKTSRKGAAIDIHAAASLLNERQTTNVRTFLADLPAKEDVERARVARALFC
jgi:hypothetical protein